MSLREELVSTECKRNQSFVELKRLTSAQIVH